MWLIFWLLLIRSSSVLARSCARAGEIRHGSGNTPLHLQGLVVFGDSLSDTGNAQALFPDGVPGGFPSGWPYGSSWPGFSTGRSSDGKLMADFFADAFGLGETAMAYLENVFPDHRKTLNFAQTGATAAAASFQNPFHLMLQVKQFLQFKEKVVNAHGGSACSDMLPSPSFFSNALYFILVGGNDINHNLKPEYGNKSVAEVDELIIPRAVAAVELAIDALYKEGARAFMVFGRPPQGCTPLFKSMYGKKNPGGFDSHGCLVAYNNLTLSLQLGLRSATERLRLKYQDSKFFFVDLYNSFFYIKENAKAYGFTDTDNACCGSGGPYNFSPKIKCGFGAEVCSDPSKFISWDGNHFTQKYYKLVVDMVLQGKFVDPPLEIRKTL